MKKLLQALALLLFSTVLCLGLFEVGFRIVTGMRSAKVEEWSDRPKFSYLHEQSVTAQDVPHSAVKPENTYRIAVVGDSFAFAPYMQFDDTFAKRLERMLNLNAVQRKVEVINYGVPRYSTTHEVDVVKRALSEQADLIVLQITLNDPEIKPYRPTGLLKEKVNRWGQVELTGGVYGYWKSLGFITQRIYNLGTVDKYTSYFFKLFDEPKTWNNFETPMGTIASLAKGKNIPLVAVVFPLYGLPIDDNYPFLRIHEKIAGLLDKLSIPQLDLLPAYRGIPISRLQVIPGKDFHPNEIGHRIAAEEIYIWLTTKSLIPAEFNIKRTIGERISIQLPAAAGAPKAEIPLDLED